MRNRPQLFPCLLLIAALAGCGAPARKPNSGLMGLDDGTPRARQVESDPVDPLLRQVTSAGDPEARIAAIRRLSRSADPRGVDALLGLLGQGGRGAAPTEVRRAALEGLALLGAARAVAAVQRATADPIPAVRASATEALGQLCPLPGGRRRAVRVHTGTAAGQLETWAYRAAELALRGVLRERGDLALTAPGCAPAAAPAPRPVARRASRRRPRRTPRRRALAPTRFRVEVSVAVRDARPQSACRVTVLVSTEPGGALKGRFSAEARIDGAASTLRLRQSIAGILASLRSDLQRAFQE